MNSCSLRCVAKTSVTKVTFNIYTHTHTHTVNVIQIAGSFDRCPRSTSIQWWCIIYVNYVRQNWNPDRPRECTKMLHQTVQYHQFRSASLLSINEPKPLQIHPREASLLQSDALRISLGFQTVSAYFHLRFDDPRLAWLHQACARGKQPRLVWTQARSSGTGGECVGGFSK